MTQSTKTILALSLVCGFIILLLMHASRVATNASEVRYLNDSESKKSVVKAEAEPEAIQAPKPIVLKSIPGLDMPGPELPKWNQPLSTMPKSGPPPPDPYAPKAGLKGQ